MINELDSNNNKKWDLPDRFRIDPANRSAHMKSLLEQSDAQQQELGEFMTSPFASMNPKERERYRAGIIAKEFQAYGIDNLNDQQCNQYAEALAICGLYWEAAKIASKEALREDYRLVAMALEVDSDIWCKCGTSHANPVIDVWNIEEKAYYSLMKCSSCGHMNARPTPDHVKKARLTRSAHRQKYSGMHPLEVKKLLEGDKR
jgi:hypothetical protein